MTSTPVFYSIVSANYLAYAITLMQSLRTHHPDAHRYVILADEARDDLELDPDLFTLVPVRDLAIPHPAQFAFRYSVLEFNTAIKPFAMGWLADRHPTATIAYIDPDIYVVSPLEKVLEATARGALAVVTPHITAPITDDKHPDEMTFLRVGTYNLGFIAAGPHPSRSALIAWWADRLEHNAYVDLESGLFTDQKWVDLVPGLFPDVHVLRDPGYNLAYWNLLHRPVTTDSDGTVRAAGEPLAFVHFSGVQVRKPELFSVHQTRYDADTIGGLRPIYDRYVAALLENGYERYARIPYRWARLDDGTAITPEMRAIFRHRFDVGQRDDAENPFGLSGRIFDEDTPPITKLSRAALRMYPRLRQWRWFRWVMTGLAPRARWALRGFFTRRSVPVSLRGARDARRARGADYPSSRPTGLEAQDRVNVIGYFKGEFGVAEAGRSLVAAAQAAGVEVALVNVDAPATARAADARLDDAIGDVAPHPVNILSVNADQTELVMTMLGPRMFEGRYNIGLWFWELGRFPAAWQGSIDRLDEIWTATSFVADSVSGTTSKPVRIVRIPVDATPTREYRRSEFGLRDDVFTFLFSFDFSSFIARKNPNATVRAFKIAFPEGDDRAALVLKSTNGTQKTSELAALRDAIGDDSRIQLLDGFMTRDQVYGLESVVDSYVSLHRSEGFGLGLAESMFLGKPVIATAYSGNMEFMNAANSCLVGYRLVDVKAGEYPFHEGQVWAEPDVEHAAYYMRRLVADSAFASDLGDRGRGDLIREFSAEAVGRRVDRELARIRTTMD